MEVPPGAVAPGATRRIWTIPNALSFLRLASVPFFVWLFVSGHENAAVILFAAVAWTDFFDGYLARRLNATSELGMLLDPLADRVLIVALAVALVVRDTLPAALALGIVARDVLILVAYPLVARGERPRIRVNPMGKFATASLLFGLTWLAMTETTFFLRSGGRDIGLAFTAIGAVTYWIAAFMYARELKSGGDVR